MDAPPLPPASDWRRRLARKDGRPVVRGCEVPVADLLREVAEAGGLDEVLRRHPGLDREDLLACFALAAEGVSAAGVDLPEVARDRRPIEPATLPPVNVAEQGTTPPLAAASVGPSRVAVPGYEVLEEVGRGGMGVVYKARHLRLNRIVALKMILAGEHAGPETLARFQIEAEAVARLQHPGIVQIFEVGEHEGHSFLALEFVEGGTLAQRLTDEPWDAREAAALVEKLARAVQAAHEKGIVHRDLKPENVLLQGSSASPGPNFARRVRGQRDYTPKITDFGLAKKLEATGQTQTGAVMGTPSYMSPEQAAGRKDIGPAADSYALGVILYRLLSGRLPHLGPTPLEVLLRVMEEEPAAPRKLNPKIPRDLETIVLRCLQKDGGRRYASAGDLADDLRRFQAGEPIRARRQSRLERAWRWSAKHPGLGIMRLLLPLTLGSVLWMLYSTLGPLLAGVDSLPRGVEAVFFFLMVMIVGILGVGWISLFVRHFCGGAPIDITAGMLVGACLGALPAVFLAALLVFALGLQDHNHRLQLQFAVTLFCMVSGGIIGAFLGAIASRRATPGDRDRTVIK
jgi:tRNA A-37 threonylcarbamoyl transferase component Bud32/uncharacterized protein (DUF433 family)